jgi:hypothetical protein
VLRIKTAIIRIGMVGQAWETSLTTSFLKRLAASAATLVLASGVAASAPASAGHWYHGGGGGWHGGGWRGGYGGWGWGAAGLGLGGLAVAPYYGDPGYSGCTTYQPIFDRWGRYLGQQIAYVC